MNFSKKKFDQNGYCVFNFNKKLILNTKKKIFHLISSALSEKHKINKITEKKIINFYHSNYKNDIVRILDHVGFFSELYSFANQKKIIEITNKAGLKFPVIGFNNKGGRGGLPFLYSFPNDKKRYYKAHQDIFYLPYSMNSVTLWVPLQNTTKKNGALKVIPKSHINYDLLGHSAKDVKNNKLNKHYTEKDFKTVDVKLGQALIFSSYLVHKSGSNNSNEVRMSFNVRYNDLLDKEYINRGLSFDKFPDKNLIDL